MVDLRKRIGDRIEQKKKELVDIREQLKIQETAWVELRLKEKALSIGIAEDEALLRDAAPKVKRVKKTLGQQIGTDAKEGQA